MLVVAVVDRLRSASAASASSSVIASRSSLDRERVRDLEHGEEMARVAFALVDEVLERVVVDRRSASSPRPRSPSASARCASSREVVVVERLEPEQRAAREQRTGEREERVLGGRADEHEQALLDERQQHVLLRAARSGAPRRGRGSCPGPRSPSRARARSATSRTSFTPALTAESVSNAFALTPATSRAIVVLPVPGGPQSTTDESRSDSIRTRSGLPGPSRCCWPTTSSSVRGRSRAASGARLREPLLHRRRKQIRPRRHARRLRRPPPHQIGRVRRLMRPPTRQSDGVGRAARLRTSTRRSRGRAWRR